MVKTIKQGHRKRPAVTLGSINYETDDQVKKKKKEEDNAFISEVEFKFLLRDKETITQGLEKFLRTAGAFTQDLHFSDIVNEHLHSSQVCAELFTILDPTNTQLRINEVSLGFECLEQILTRIRTDLSKFSSTGEAIIQRILANHMGQLYNCLRDQNNSKTIKSGLQLLIAMVMLSDRTRKAVQARLKFAHVNFPPLFKRRNRKDEKDVRSCTVLLTLTFLLDGDHNSINQLVQQKAWLQMTISGLMYDRRDMVVDVLVTILDKVVKSPGVSKTDKIKLFSENILKKLCELYAWEGPDGWVASGKKLQGKSKSELEMTTEQEHVAEVAHQFLMELCCSHKYGLNFLDKMVGTGSRNQNQLLEHFSDWLIKKLEDPRRAELALAILCACPDQIKNILTSLSPSLTPRWSVKWQQLMDWIIKLYKALPEVPPFLTCQDIYTDNVHSLVTRASVFCLPPLKLATLLTQALKNDDHRVHQKCLQLVNIFAKKSLTLSSHLTATISSHAGTERPTPESSWTEIFISHVMRSLPSIHLLMACVEKVNHRLNQTDVVKSVLKDEDMEESIVVLLLQVLNLYQSLTPALLWEKPRHLTTLVDMVTYLGHKTRQQRSEREDVDNLCLPHLFLMNLFANSDAKKLSLGREGLLDKLLHAISQRSQYTDLAISLVCKMLASVEVFHNYTQELKLWLTQAIHKSLPKKTEETELPKASISFLAQCLTALMNNPTPYVDTLLEIITDPDGQTMDTSEAKDTAINAVLLMDDQNLDRLLTSSQTPAEVSGLQASEVQLPISPLVIVALERLHLTATVKREVREFVSRVLVSLLHSTSNPRLVATVVKKYPTKLCRCVRPYLQYWSSENVQEMVIQPLPATVVGHLTATLMCHRFELEHENIERVLVQELEQMPCQDLLLSLQQILFYISESLQLLHQSLKYKKRLEIDLDILKTLMLATLVHNSKYQRTKTTTVPSVLPGITSFNDFELLEVLFSDVHLFPDATLTACTSVLFNPNLHPFIFSAPCQKHWDVSVMVSTCINHILGEVQKHQCLKDDKKLMQDLVTMMVTKLCEKKGAMMSDQLEKLCSASVELFIPYVDLLCQCKCAVQILQLPIGTLISTQDSASTDKETPTGRILCSLLKQITCQVKKHPSYICASIVSSPSPEKHSFKSCEQDAELTSDLSTDNQEAAKWCHKNRYVIRSSFNFEETTKQPLLAWTPLFGLLAYSTNSQLRQFVQFLIMHDPSSAVVVPHSFLQQLLTDLQDQDLICSLTKYVRQCFFIFEAWLLDHGHKLVQGDKWKLLVSYLEASLVFSGEYTETVRTLQYATRTKLKKIKVDCQEHLDYLTLLSKVVAHNDVIFQELLAETMAKHIKKQKNVLLSHFVVLNFSCSFLPPSSKIQKSLDNKCAVLDLVLGHLTFLSTNNRTECFDLENGIIDLVLSLVPQAANEELDVILSHWDSLVNITLRHRLTNGKLLGMMTMLVSTVYTGQKLKSSRAQPVPDTVSLFRLCVQHTMFHMLMSSPEYMTVKGELVKLLHCLCEIEPSCSHHVQDVSTLVVAYRATLTTTDQGLLLLLKKCHFDLQTKFECPLLWGQTALDHQCVSQLLGSSLKKQVTVTEILDQLNVQCLNKSILQFPVRRRQQDSDITDARDFKSESDCYDPNFLLQLFVQVLSPDKIVPLHVFVEKNCLSYLLIALSSHDLHIRLLAYQALNDFYLHALGSKWRENTEMIFILDLLNGSRVKDGQKLSYVVALFLARVVKLLLYPADPLYRPICHFLVAKPELDLINVPEFYQFFYSAGPQCKHERKWILSLLCDGMREPSDYWLYQKKYIFKILMTFYLSSLSDSHSQTLILHLMINACKEKSVAVDLVKNHGFLSWLAAAVNGLEKQSDHSQLLCELTHQLWQSLTSPTIWYTCQYSQPLHSVEEDVLTEGKQVDNIDVGDSHCWPSVASEPSCARQVPKSTLVDMSLILKALIWHLRTCPATLLRITKVLFSMITMGSEVCTKTELSVGHSNTVQLSATEAILLLYHVAKVIGHQPMASECQNVLYNQGLDIESPQTHSQSTNLEMEVHGDSQERSQIMAEKLSIGIAAASCQKEDNKYLFDLCSQIICHASIVKLV